MTSLSIGNKTWTPSKPNIPLHPHADKVGRFSALQFGMLEDVSEWSVFEVQEIKDLMSARLGNSKFSECRTCLQANCNGHLGHISLCVPVPRLIFVDRLIYLFESICYYDHPRGESRLVWKGEVPEMYESDIICNLSKKDKSIEPIVYISRQAKHIRNCPVCNMHRVFLQRSKGKETVIPIIQITTEEAATFPAVSITPTMLYRSVESLKEEDWKFLGFKQHPKYLFWTDFPVLPPFLRQPQTVKDPTKIKVYDSDIKKNLTVIMNCNKKMQDVKNAKFLTWYKIPNRNKIFRNLKSIGNRNADIEMKMGGTDAWERYQRLCIAIGNFTHNFSRHPLNQRQSYNADKPPRTVGEIMGSKGGHVSSGVVYHQTPCDNTARAVIEPTTNIMFWEIGLSVHKCTRMSRLHHVPTFSQGRQWLHLRKSVLNGPHVYPGANRLILHDGKEMVLSQYVEQGFDLMDIVHKYYDEGLVKLVDCHLQKGDYVTLSRNPCLHQGSSMVVKIGFLHQSHVIYVHPLLCELMGSDFDGDEENVHAFQYLDDAIECFQVMNPTNFIMINGSVWIKPFHYVTLGLYKLSKNLVRDDIWKKEKRRYLNKFRETWEQIPGFVKIHLQHWSEDRFAEAEKNLKLKPKDLLTLCLPVDFPYVDDHTIWNKKNVQDIIKKLWFYYRDLSGSWTCAVSLMFMWNIGGESGTGDSVGLDDIVKVDNSDLLEEVKKMNNYLKENFPDHDPFKGCATLENDIVGEITKIVSTSSERVKNLHQKKGTMISQMVDSGVLPPTTYSHFSKGAIFQSFMIGGQRPVHMNYSDDLLQKFGLHTRSYSEMKDINSILPSLPETANSLYQKNVNVADSGSMMYYAYRFFHDIVINKNLNCVNSNELILMQQYNRGWNNSYLTETKDGLFPLEINDFLTRWPSENRGPKVDHTLKDLWQKRVEGFGTDPNFHQYLNSMFPEVIKRKYGIYDLYHLLDRIEDCVFQASIQPGDQVGLYLVHQFMERRYQEMLKRPHSSAKGQHTHIASTGAQFKSMLEGTFTTSMMKVKLRPEYKWTYGKMMMFGNSCMKLDVKDVVSKVDIQGRTVELHLNCQLLYQHMVTFAMLSKIWKLHCKEVVVNHGEWGIGNRYVVQLKFTQLKNDMEMFKMYHKVKNTNIQGSEKLRDFYIHEQDNSITFVGSDIELMTTKDEVDLSSITSSNAEQFREFFGLAAAQIMFKKAMAEIVSFFTNYHDVHIELLVQQLTLSGCFSSVKSTQLHKAVMQRAVISFTSRAMQKSFMQGALRNKWDNTQSLSTASVCNNSGEAGTAQMKLTGFPMRPSRKRDFSTICYYTGIPEFPGRSAYLFMDHMAHSQPLMALVFDEKDIVYLPIPKFHRHGPEEWNPLYFGTLIYGQLHWHASRKIWLFTFIDCCQAFGNDLMQSLFPVRMTVMRYVMSHLFNNQMTKFDSFQNPFHPIEMPQIYNKIHPKASTHYFGLMEDFYCMQNPVVCLPCISKYLHSFYIQHIGEPFLNSYRNKKYYYNKNCYHIQVCLMEHRPISEWPKEVIGEETCSRFRCKEGDRSIVVSYQGKEFVIGNIDNLNIQNLDPANLDANYNVIPGPYKLLWNHSQFEVIEPVTTIETLLTFVSFANAVDRIVTPEDFQFIKIFS